MMLYGAASGALELRAENGGIRLTGRFPYEIEAELLPGRFELVKPRAFASRIDAGADLHLLAGHDFNRPLASRAAGSLTLRDTDAALEIEARIDGGTTWAQDFLAAHKAGLVRGLSPGFRVPPGGDRIERRENGLLRRVQRAELFEISAVTRPVYNEATVEARNWQPGAGGAQPARRPAALRWR